MSPALSPSRRGWLWAFIGMTALAIALLALAVGSPRGWTVSILPLQLADNAAAFKALVLEDWRQGSLAGGEPLRFWRLRGNLFVDSILFVPGYMALLLFFTMAFGPAPDVHPIRRQLLCVPAVAAGLFDIAENGMTGRALDDLIDFALVDATVADVNLAVRIKWVLLGLALAVLAWRAVATASDDRPWRPVAAALCGVAALAFVGGGSAASATALIGGLVAAAAGLGLLCARALRRSG